MVADRGLRTMEASCDIRNPPAILNGFARVEKLIEHVLVHRALDDSRVVPVGPEIEMAVGSKVISDIAENGGPHQAREVYLCPLSS